MEITLRLLVRQDWYETEFTKTGWDCHGWYCEEVGINIDVENSGWTVVSHLEMDKYGNPTLGIIEKVVKLN